MEDEFSSFFFILPGLKDMDDKFPFRPADRFREDC